MPDKNLVDSSSNKSVDTSAFELEALKRELAELKSKIIPEKTSVEEKIDALVNQRINEFKEAEKRRVEEARKILEEAKENERLERELATNEKYRIKGDHIELLEQQFMKQMEVIKQTCKDEEYKKNLFAKAAMGDPSARGIANLCLLASRYSPMTALNMLRKNLGLQPRGV